MGISKIDLFKYNMKEQVHLNQENENSFNATMHVSLEHKINQNWDLALFIYYWYDSKWSNKLCYDAASTNSWKQFH
jgi:hypothetical protein